MQTNQVCVTGCGRPTRDSRLLCDHDVWVLERALAELPALLSQLETTLTRQTRIGDRPGRRAAEHAVPFDERASAALDGLRTVLNGWVRVIVEDHDDSPPVDNLRAMSGYLQVRLDLLAAHEAAYEIYDEITTACSRGWRAVDLAAERIFVDVCSCGEWLYAKPTAQEIECRTCQRRHDVAASRERLWQVISQRLMTISEIIYWGVQLERIEQRDVKRARNRLDQWVARKRLVPHSVDRHGHGLYPFDETVQAVVACTETRQQAA